jgi:hypothetical protein
MENLQVWQQNQRSHQLLNQKPRKNQSDPNKVCFFFPAKEDLKSFSLKSWACALRHLLQHTDLPVLSQKTQMLLVTA